MKGYGALASWPFTTNDVVEDVSTELAVEPTVELTVVVEGVPQPATNIMTTEGVRTAIERIDQVIEPH